MGRQRRVGNRITGRARSALLEVPAAPVALGAQAFALPALQCAPFRRLPLSPDKYRLPRRPSPLTAAVQRPREPARPWNLRGRARDGCPKGPRAFYPRERLAFGPRARARVSPEQEALRRGVRGKRRREKVGFRGLSAAARPLSTPGPGPKRRGPRRGRKTHRNFGRGFGHQLAGSAEWLEKLGTSELGRREQAGWVRRVPARGLHAQLARGSPLQLDLGGETPARGAMLPPRARPLRGHPV